MRKSFATIALVLTVAACGGKQPGPAQVRTSSDVLTREQIMAVPVDNLYDAIQRLRPRFLRPHPTGSSGQAYAVVFVDGLRRGSFDTLRSIATGAVQEIRYISALDATTRYGLNIGGGVLQVTLSGR